MRGEVSRSNAFIAVALGVLLVSLPLAATSIRVARDSLAEARSSAAMHEWLQQSSYELRDVDSRGGELTVLIAGEGNPPPSSELLSGLNHRLGHRVMLDLQIVPIQVESLDIVPVPD